MKETFQILTCERCGRKDEIRRPVDLCGWGHFSTWLENFAIDRNFHEHLADIEFKRTDVPQELCPACFEGLRDWWTLGEVPGARVQRAIDRAGTKS